MENKYVIFGDLKLNERYWVVNGHWEFKVTAILENKVKIYIYGTSRHHWYTEAQFNYDFKVIKY